MVEIGGEPILSHVMRIYAASNFTDFIVCCGYKGDVVKQYYANYFIHKSDIEVDLSTGEIKYLSPAPENWKITMVDTGRDTLTGGRVKRVASYLQNETFALTYGDGVSNVSIADVLAFHKKHGKLATVVAVPSPGRFGILEIDGASVTEFREKPTNEMGYINGGFFILERAVIDYIEGDQTTWEREPLERLASDGQLQAYRHDGFWKPMDTLRDKMELDAMVAAGKAPWLPTGRLG